MNDNATGGGLRGADIFPNTLKGSDIDESSLGAVPNANNLGGTPASGYARGFRQAGTINSGGSLDLAVPSVDTFHILCRDGGTTGVDTDDEVEFVFESVWVLCRRRLRHAGNWRQQQ